MKKFTDIFIVLIVASIALFIIGIGIFACIDKLFLSDNNSKVRVYEKIFIPNHTEEEYKYNPAFEVFAPEEVEIPDTWKVKVDLDTLKGEFKVSKEFFMKVHISDSIQVTYKISRISKEIIVKKYE